MHEREARRNPVPPGAALSGSERSAGEFANAAEDAEVIEDAKASTTRPAGSPPPNALLPSPPRYLKHNDSARTVFRADRRGACASDFRSRRSAHHATYAAYRRVGADLPP
ncbi:MAG: Glutamine amidotransferase, class I [uncultured Paraburkholderia sp.]|nr:MAG: Glutamine amidotransferase, class I [uncultured Paraburkholderia sp.]CAH2927325.1 MAG: Glutamine amidotransferase, class I [uncultured Paraburkholderia sp.]